MNKILIVFIALILPSASGEMAHNPQEVSEGTTFTACIDVDEDVESVTKISSHTSRALGE